MRPPVLTAILRDRGVPGFGSEKCAPPKWVLDMQAERTITGGYSKRKNPVCPGCGIQRSVSGSCECNS